MLAPFRFRASSLYETQRGWNQCRYHVPPLFLDTRTAALTTRFCGAMPGRQVSPIVALGPRSGTVGRPVFISVKGPCVRQIFPELFVFFARSRDAHSRAACTPHLRGVAAGREGRSAGILAATGNRKHLGYL